MVYLRKCQKFNGFKVQWFKSVMMWRFKSTKVQKYNGIKV